MKENEKKESSLKKGKTKKKGKTRRNIKKLKTKEYPSIHRYIHTWHQFALQLAAEGKEGEQHDTNIDKEGSSYKYQIDMSYAADGVYILQLGDKKSGIFQTGKIIVK